MFKVFANDDYMRANLSINSGLAK